jgi:hypothetical protein
VNRTVALIDELSQLGVTLSRTGNQIVIDGPEAVLTDALVEKLRTFKSEILQSLEDWGFADWQAFYDERVGIAEFDGQVSRLEAEGRAYESCVVEWLNRHHETSALGQCARCGQVGRSDHVVVNFGTDNHTWLHPECWPAWHEARRAEAIVMLSGMEIVAPTETEITEWST